MHLSATPNSDLRAMIMVCRESPTKLSQGISTERWNREGCGQYEVRGEKESFTNGTACQEDKAERTSSRN